MGGKSGGAATDGRSQELSAEARRLAGIQANQSESLFNDSGPLRADVLRLVQGGLQGVNDPINLDTLTANPLFGAFKQGNELAFDQARQRAIESTPEGGALSGVLGNIESQRAGAATQGFGVLASDEAGRRRGFLDRGQNLSLGFPSLGLSGLSGAGSTLSQLSGNQAAIAESQANRSAGKSSAAGGALGTLGSAIIGKKGTTS